MSVLGKVCAAVRRLLGRSSAEIEAASCRFRAPTAAEMVAAPDRHGALMPPTLVEVGIARHVIADLPSVAPEHTPARAPQNYMFAARLASVRSLNRPKSRRGETAPAASAVKTVAPRRVVWIAERPTLARHRSAQIIPFPARALQRRRWDQAA